MRIMLFSTLVVLFQTVFVSAQSVRCSHINNEYIETLIAQNKFELAKSILDELHMCGLNDAGPHLSSTIIDYHYMLAKYYIARDEIPNAMQSYETAIDTIISAAAKNGITLSRDMAPLPPAHIYDYKDILSDMIKARNKLRTLQMNN